MSTSAAVLPANPSSARRVARPSRWRGTGQVFGSFAAVFAAYCIYWLLAVPLIEPDIEASVAGGPSEDVFREAREAVSARKQALTRYFPAGSWELDNPAVWETDQTMLLFKTPQPVPGSNRVILKYCTLLYFPRTRGEIDVAKARPVVMRAADGAEMEFDEPIDPKTVDLGKRKLKKGWLHGQITIVREPSQPGAADDLLITTRDVELIGNRATSPHPVQFRMGRSHGGGRDLEILLAAADGQSGTFGSGKVQSLSLKRDVVMHLVMDDEMSGRSRTPGAAPQPPEAPTKINCQGPFQYDFVRSTASFNDRVDVVRLGDGPGDQLNCQILTVFFEQRGGPQADGVPPKPAVPTDPNAPRSNLPIVKLEARGDPVTLRSQSRGLYIHCRGLDYAPAPGGAIGRMSALGPGVMQGSTPGNPLGKFQIQWVREMRFEPAENGQYVASLVGGAKVRMAGLGEITAEDRLDAEGRLVEQGKIFAWATPLKKPTLDPRAAAVRAPRPAIRQVAMQVDPNANVAPPIQPAGGAGKSPGEGDSWQVERVLAQGHVVIDVPQLDGVTGKLEAWVERPKVEAGSLAAPVAGAPEAAPDEPARGPRRPPATAGQRYAVRAGSIQVKLLPRGKEYDVAGVTLEDQAHLQELSAKPGVKPLVVSGSRLHVADANGDQTHVTVNGTPALVEAGGMTLNGETIELEKHTNHLWVEGPGKLSMPVDRDPTGRALEQPQNVNVGWAGRMNFQSNTVVFERDVKVTTQLQLLSTAKLEAVLDRPIDFSNADTVPRPAAGGGRAAQGPQLAFVRCYGEAVLDSRELDANGAQVGIDRMTVLDLAINQQTGDISGLGPGWVRHVGRENNERSRARVGPPGQARPQAPARPGLGLTHLFVQFEKSLSGNINRREVTFGEPTKTLYAPVADWTTQLDPENPASLGPEGVVLDAKQLTVRQMPGRSSTERGFFELVAQGNVLAEGSQFEALGQQVTYSEDKDQLILEGDTRSPAEIRYTPLAGGRRNETKAAKVIYSVGAQHVLFSGAQSISFDGIPTRPPAEAKK